MSDKSKPNTSTNQRKRTNILKNFEAKTIQFLCSIMPDWISSDMLTFIGGIGSIIIAVGLYFGNENQIWLLISIFGFIVQWFGDSLDGRLAYYRNTPRKWYGWSLDITVDWLSVGIIGFGFYYYFNSLKPVAFLFIFAYGWSMINALLRYKITDVYSIDASAVGPTELRIIICLFILAEFIFPNALLYFGVFGSALLIVINTFDTISILKAGDARDKSEKSQILKENKL
ncbi:MAG: CDP-alcohol phosphatidyltransferase family protein [Saprospiraceae bacterium]